MENTHSLTANQFTELASGSGSAETVGRLVVAESSIQRELLAAVGQFGPQRDRRFAAAWELLTALDVTAPDAVATVLAHPYAREWAVGLLNDLQAGTPALADAYHLEALAASAAVHAGLDLRVPVPVRGEVAPLPTFGALAADGQDRVWIHAGSMDRFELAEPLRTMTAGDLTVTLEDTDPYRVRPYIDTEIHPADRLPAKQAGVWRRAFIRAMNFIDLHLPGYGEGLRAGLRAVTPLRSDGVHDRSASARLAFGAVGIAPRRVEPISLALLLIHEFQHVKLGAIMDLFELHDLADTQPRYAPPCFAHPRPIEGLFQSTYAHLGICEFWRIHRNLTSGDAHAAGQAHFARSRALTLAGIERLLEADSLTSMGRTFVLTMQDSLAPWLAESVDRDAEAAATRAVADQLRREDALADRSGTANAR
ncbi:aKG-HExxH-type peptide beta-hydroxylase [Nocardia alni]|uniref:aKG-HExxH-type peptide beta-hydroxylase n=1 Tax=Nocardia alni TaxID=2815723 RepID=UPI001C23712C|nr:HEXXH motif-containing putative peptide modification protein [Nocardia alni]